ncbi:MAG TPA: alpha/beta fold hydrolase [Candidatus Paceibacterota bacterium]|nr:alpha/beta fold hydrolase [Candidatus Paceibacterota bacterium]
MGRDIFSDGKEKIIHMAEAFGLVAVLALTGTSFAYADTGTSAANPQDEIHYGAVAASKGDQIGLEYRGPSGILHYVCSLGSNDCTAQDASSTFFQTGAAAASFELTSPDGKYGLRSFAIQTPSGMTVYYSLYDLSGTTPVFDALLPFHQVAVKKQFTADSQNIVFITQDNHAVRYSITSGQMTTASISGTDLPFWTVSPSGQYMSAYNYVQSAHQIYDLDTNTSAQVKGTDPSYLEFGDDNQAAYEDQNGNFQSLYAVDLSGMSAAAASVLPKQITDGNFEIEDYLFVGSHLFYMANKDNPMIWSIYEYDFQTGDSTDIADNVSYGEYMKAQDGKLLYQKLDGKNANIFSYDPETGVTYEFAPEGDSPASDAVSRETVKLNNGRYAVLLSPKDSSKKEKDLFIWLHGGPMRQASVGYHSYLSYGVYDELLERLAASGAYVLKLDYTGSSGYGKQVLDGLDANVGKADVDDVLSAAKELQQEKGIDHTYLIGNSYGGYLSLRALVEDPSLFDGAVSINGVTDWYSLITRIPSSPFKDLFHGLPNAANMGLYLQASVDAKIPSLPDSEKILVAYGGKDTEVPNWQSTNFISFAKAFGKDVQTAYYPDEEHILRERSTLDDLCTAVVNRFDLSGVDCHL